MGGNYLLKGYLPFTADKGIFSHNIKKIKTL